MSFSFLKRPFRFLAVMMLGAVVLSFQPTEAKGLFSRKPPEDPKAAQIRTYQPPPVNAVAMYCEPYRREAAVLSHKHFPLGIFYAPRRAWLIRQHRRCREELMAQENLYLKHVDIEQPATPPKTQTQAPVRTPAEKSTEGVPHAGN